MFSSEDALVDFLMLSWSAPSSFPRHHSKITPIVSVCMSEERHYSFDNLGKEWRYLIVEQIVGFGIFSEWMFSVGEAFLLHWISLIAQDTNFPARENHFKLSKYRG